MTRTYAGLLVRLLVIVPSAVAQRSFSGAAEIEQSLHKLNELGTVLHIAAHPDDERTAVLAYFARGRYMRTAYLSLTRGEGGQNLIGSEQGAQLGLIRTRGWTRRPWWSRRATAAGPCCRNAGSACCARALRRHRSLQPDPGLLLRGTGRHQPQHASFARHGRDAPAGSEPQHLHSHRRT